MIVSPWDKGTQLFEAALDVRSAKHEVIAANIANEETPGYKARQLPFRQTLDAVLQGHDPIEPLVTHPGHIPISHDSQRIIRHVSTMNTGSGPDGNTVSLEQAMTEMSENALLYMAVSQLLAGRFDGWRAAINEGRGG